MATDDALRAAGLRTIHGDAAEGSALDRGATVLSWRPRDHDEVLFVSREALVAPGDEIHGGIPVCAPWFGKGRDGVTVPHIHGLVRWVPWRLARADPDRLAWELRQRDVAHLPGADAYPDDLTYRLVARFGTTLEVRLTVTSPTTAFVLDEGLHVYLRAADVTACRVEGLEGATFRDFATGAAPDVEHEPVRFGHPVDRVYRHSGPATLVEGDRRVTVSQEGGSNVVVWNPGPGVDLLGFGEDEWRSMVCVEVGNVQQDAVVVEAGQQHTLTLRITVDS